MIVIGAGNPGWTFTFERMKQLKYFLIFSRLKQNKRDIIIRLCKKKHLNLMKF